MVFLFSVPLAFDFLDQPAVCAAFSRALNRPVRYVEGPIEIRVPIPTGYRDQLDALQQLFGGPKVGGHAAPYWWKGLFDVPGDARAREKRQRQRRRTAVR